MDILLNAALTVAGLAMLCFGGNWLVGGGTTIARKFRISSFVIGMTIVAYGTSTPELAASIAAATGGYNEIILGNVIGSNIANVGMVIGIAAVLVPLAVGRSAIRKEIPVMLGVSVLLVLVSSDGMLSAHDGILMLAGLGIFSVYTLKGVMRRHQKSKESRIGPARERVGIKPFGLIVIGTVLLYAGAVLTVDNAVALARELDLSEKVIGPNRHCRGNVPSRTDNVCHCHQEGQR